MKLKTTMKEVKQNAICYCFGYGDIQTILYYDNAVAYTCGTYGWNADIYQTDYDNTVIVTGYRPWGYTLHDYDLARKMETYAKGIKYSDTYKEQITAIRDDLFRLIHADYRAFHSEYGDANYKAECMTEYEKIHKELEAKYDSVNK